jgi:alginate O-acetyltransferase complex protein AlgI
MLFSQAEFVVFFLILYACLLLLSSYRTQKLLLLAASYYFYAYWDWRFCFLLLSATTLDYLIGRGMNSTNDRGLRKLLLCISLTYNLSVLGFFKYYNFFVESFDQLVSPLGWRVGSMEIILPVGISFFTFQTLSYTIDSYFRRIDCCKNYWDYLLFVSFFPQLVAGPIVRAAEFLPQLAVPRKHSWHQFYIGFRQFTFGLFKKIFIADRIAPTVETVFSAPDVFDSATVWLAVLCFAAQIYCDFSGYSDMAIGTARALGYDIPLNFAHPYLAIGFPDFWRRWHVSLSSWLRDYLYIPLGGNRHGPIRTQINLFVTMILGGLWHGAAWTFVAWGAIHGIALALTRPLRNLTVCSRWHPVIRRPIMVISWSGTFLVVLVAWVFFRASSFANAKSVLGAMFWEFEGVRWLPPFGLFAVAFVATTHAIQLTRWHRYKELPPDRWYTPAVLFTLIGLVVVFYPKGFTPFIYFQF